MVGNESQWLTSRLKWRQSISMGFSKGCRWADQTQPPSCPAQHRLDLVVLAGLRVIPGYMHGTHRVFPAGLRAARLSICTDAVALFGLGESRDHHLMTLGAPRGPEGGHQVLVGVVEVIFRFETVAGFFDRLF